MITKFNTNMNSIQISPEVLKYFFIVLNKIGVLEIKIFRVLK